MNALRTNPVINAYVIWTLQEWLLGAFRMTVDIRCDSPKGQLCTSSGNAGSVSCCSWLILLGIELEHVPRYKFLVSHH